MSSPEEERIADLESQVNALWKLLEEYHRRLENSVERRDAIIHRAAWAMAYVVIPLGAILCAGYLLGKWFDFESRIGGLIGGIAFFASWIGSSAWLGSLQEKDKEEFGELPHWDDILEQHRTE